METVASKVPFYQFAVLLDKISAQSGAERKKQFLRGFIDEWRAYHNRLHSSTTTVRVLLKTICAVSITLEVHFYV